MDNKNLIIIVLLGVIVYFIYNQVNNSGPPQDSTPIVVPDEPVKPDNPQPDPVNPHRPNRPNPRPNPSP